MDTAAGAYRRKVETLHDALNDERSRAEAAAIPRGLIDDLAGIMALATGWTSKKPLQNRGLEVSEIKLVAGARNHRNLLVDVLAML